MKFEPQNIPKTWESIEDFTQWYIDVGMPIFPPLDSQVYITDHTHSMIIFRHDVYQVEQYFVKPDIWVPPHSHIDFENVIVYLAGEFWSKRSTTPDELDQYKDTPYKELVTFGKMDCSVSNKNNPHNLYKVYGNKLNPGEFHAFRTFDRGCSFLSIEKWVTNKNFLTSAVVAYDGESLGPVHDRSLSKFNSEFA